MRRREQRKGEGRRGEGRSGKERGWEERGGEGRRGKEITGEESRAGERREIPLGGILGYLSPFPPPHPHPLSPNCPLILISHLLPSPPSFSSPNYLPLPLHNYPSSSYHPPHVLSSHKIKKFLSLVHLVHWARVRLSLGPGLHPLWGQGYTLSGARVRLSLGLGLHSPWGQG